LAIAASEGQVGIVNLLLEKGVDIESKDMTGCTPLSLATQCGREALTRFYDHEEVRTLAINAAAVKPKDVQESVPLTLAAQYHGYEAIMKLIFQEQNAEILVRKNSAGFTPLALAVRYAQAEVVRSLLLSKGVAVNVTTNNLKGNTPFAPGAELGHEEIVKLLFKELDDDAVIHPKDVVLDVVGTS
jgi:ankyrin repeat protein